MWGFVRDNLPEWCRMEPKEGDSAPDAALVSLDGETIFHLRENIGSKPLVLIFGGFT